MNEIYNSFPKFIIFYIDYVLVLFLFFPENLNKHFKYLNVFLEVTKRNDLVVSKNKTMLFKTKICFLSHNIFQGTIAPIEREYSLLKSFSIK